MTSTNKQLSENTRSKELEAWFKEYELDHKDPKNQLTHMVGIPLIVLGLLKLFQRVSLGPTNVALLLVVAIVVFFVKHDRKLALTFGGILLAAYVLSFVMLSVKLAWFCFIVGWGLQFLGHYKYEKRSPAFFKNLLHLLIGPLWLTAKLSKTR